MGEATVGRLLTEWLNSNQHRAYPLDDSTAGNGLPTAFLVDALFINSESIDSTRLYITSIIKDNANVLISMGGYVDGVEVDFGIVATVPYTTLPGTSIPIELVTDSYKLAGSFTVGDVSCLRTLPAILTLGAATGLLFPGCVRSVSDTLLGIRVNDVLYTGIVTLAPGDGIEFIVEDTAEGTVLTARSVEYAIPEANLAIVDDDSLLSSAIELYGRPIRTICNIKPDAEGDIIFSTPDIGGESSEQYVEATGGGEGGAVCLTIANDKTDIQCTDYSDSIAALAQSLSNLNERGSDISEDITAMDEALSNLALQVSRS